MEDKKKEVSEDKIKKECDCPEGGCKVCQCEAKSKEEEPPTT